MSLTSVDPVDVGASFDVFFEITVENQEGQDPVDAVVTVNLTGPNDCTISNPGSQNITVSGIGPPGVALTIGVPVTCTQPSFHLFNGTTTAVASDPELDDTDSGNNTAAAGLTLAAIAHPDLVVTKTAEIVRAKNGDDDSDDDGFEIDECEFGDSDDDDACNIKFTVTVTNNGPDDATGGVQVSDGLPADLMVVSSMTSVGTYDANTGIWDGFDLAVGDEETLMITAKVISGDDDDSEDDECKTITNVAEASVLGQHVVDPDPDNNQASVSIDIGEECGDDEDDDSDDNDSDD